MRILAWMQAYYPVIGGVQTAARQLFPALRASGHEVAVVASHFSIELPDLMFCDSIPVHRFRFQEALASKNPAALIQEIRRAAKFMTEFAPDIVHLMGFEPGTFFFLRARKSYPVPFLLTIHSEIYAYLSKTHGTALLKQAVTEASWITTVTALEAKRVAALLPEAAGKVSCVYQGLEQPQVEAEPLPSAPRLLCIGRLAPEKNFELAVRAFAALAPDFPHARLVFAGDGTERPMLEQLVTDLGIGNQVDFLGWVPPEQIYSVMNQASAVVLPSHTEGLPLVGVEAAQMARPLIATNVSGVPELVVDGVTGLLTPPGDVDAMAAAMRVVLSDRARTEQMGQAARARAAEIFSLTRMVNGFSALYERIVTNA